MVDIRSGRLSAAALAENFADVHRPFDHGGAVVELHAYGVAPGIDEEALRDDLMQAFKSFYPEFSEAKIINERFLMRRDCPSFAPGSDTIRPTVATAHEGITLAGDFVRLPIPTALMERAVASGFLAANCLLASQDIKPEPIRSIPLSGLFGRRSRLKTA